MIARAGSSRPVAGAERCSANFAPRAVCLAPAMDVAGPIVALAVTLLALNVHAEAPRLGWHRRASSRANCQLRAWAGDEKTNAFIAWVGAKVARRYGVVIISRQAQGHG